MNMKDLNAIPQAVALIIHYDYVKLSTLATETVDEVTLAQPFSTRESVEHLEPISCEVRFAVWECFVCVGFWI